MNQKPLSPTTNTTTNTERPLRTVKSFARRQGRLTDGQKQAMDTLWSKYGIDLPTNIGETLDLDHLFAQRTDLTLEIGFGNGASLLQEVAAAPERNFLGIEVYFPGVGQFIAGLDELQANNARVIASDAMDVVNYYLSEASVDRVQIFFPDPWPKKRHHKRRLVQVPFVHQLAKVLKPGGTLHVATDWQHYAEHALAVLGGEQLLQNTSQSGDYVERPDYRPLTKFEQRGIKLGHGVWDLVFVKRT